MAEEHDQREVRKEYRELLEDTVERKHELAQTNSEALSQQLAKGASLFAKASSARTALVDSHVFKQMAEIGREKGKNLGDQTPADFLTNLKAKYSRGLGDSAALDWVRLGQEISPLFRRVPMIDLLYGTPCEEAIEKKRERRKVEKQVLAQQETAQTASTETLEKDVDATQMRRMQVLHDTLIEESRATGEVDFFRLILHPTSFSQTVENIFDFAFLVKDGNAQLDESDGLPVARPKNPPTADEYSNGLQKTQNILKLNHDIWKKLVEKYGNDPLLPDRTPEKPMSRDREEANTSSAPPAKRMRRPDIESQ